MKHLPSITVIGSNGWIGSGIVRSAQSQGCEVHCIDRANVRDWLVSDVSNTYIYYAAGMTGNYRQNVAATLDAHVSLLSRVLEKTSLGITYLSSTRLYSLSSSTSEADPIRVCPGNIDSIYEVTKLCGESLVLTHNVGQNIVLRLSNVIGPGIPPSLFVGAILNGLRKDFLFTIKQNRLSSKDYVCYEDVVDLSLKLIFDGYTGIFNIASGRNTSAETIAHLFVQNGFKIEFDSCCPAPALFPSVCNEKVSRVLYAPRNPFADPLIIDTLLPDQSLIRSGDTASLVTREQNSSTQVHY